MLRLRQMVACGFVCVAAIASPRGSAAVEATFPFDRDLVLDAAPMPGSKRVPILEIEAGGAASIDLWCVTVQAKASVGADTITIVPTAAQRGQCGPESIASDESLLAAIAQVTGWRRRGDVIELTGATTLRFRLMTN
jgi:hypothetical protein